MSDLVSSIRATIHEFVNSKSESHTKADVLRVLRDQSALLYERQLVLDALTLDPMKQYYHEYAPQVDRIQKLLQVTSCHRLVTREGLSLIEAIVQLEKDNDDEQFMSTMVDHHVQITFRYERRPILQQHQQQQQQHHQQQQQLQVDNKTNVANVASSNNRNNYQCAPTSDNDTTTTTIPTAATTAQIPTQQQQQQQPNHGTHICYTIDINKDFGEKSRLFIVECWAVGEMPSLEPAQPMEEEDDNEEWEDIMDEEEEENNSQVAMDSTNMLEDTVTNQGTTMDVAQDEDNAMDGSTNNRPLSDKFAAYMDPDVVDQLKSWLGLDMDEAPLFFLLMTFPFWEQEWDLVGFAFQAIFEGDDEIDFEEDDDNDDDENDDESTSQ